MSYQENMFSLEVMQDRRARMGHGTRVKLPVMNRGECQEAAVARARGEQSCPFVNCEYHLWGEALRSAGEDKVVDMQIQRWEGEMPHTCTLDIADDGGAETDSEIALYTGIERDKVPQRIAEASFKMRKKMEDEVKNNAAWTSNRLSDTMMAEDDDTALPSRAKPNGLGDDEDNMSFTAMGEGFKTSFYDI